MPNLKKSMLACLAVCSGVGGVAGASAQEEDERVLEEIVVTGVVRPTTKFESSMSVSALSSDDVKDFAPRSTAEIFRNIPGIQSESSSGDANANIKVRGMPISAGGARYLSIQENGFPMLLVGDPSFITADSLIRFDSTVGSVQSIRGGSASTQAFNAPGGVINFISKTGGDDAGSIGFTTGLDYDALRLDFEYGGSLGGEWTYHVGGFYRSGEGPREAVGDLEEGGQVKATFARDFDRGSVKVHLRTLDDSVPTYLPIPARYDGGTSFSSVGVSLEEGTLFLSGSDLLQRKDGIRSTELENAFETSLTSVGVEADYEVTDLLTAAFSHRTASIDGTFTSPFPAEVFNTANGPATRIHYFNTEFDNLDNSFTDLSLSGEFGSITAKIGVEFASQDLGTTWGWNTYFRQLDGNLTAFDQEGSVGGLLYGHPLWGNCCQRAYDFEIDGTAPYVSLAGEIGDNFRWEASYRDNDFDVDGTFAESAVIVPLDIDGNGVIASNEQAVPTLGAPSRADYSVNFDAWSLGVNWSVTESIALFANLSEGGSLGSPDRLTGSIQADGSIQEQSAFNTAEQFEIGLKYRGDLHSVYVTLFDSEVAEARQFEVTTQQFLENTYESQGVEVEADFDFQNGFGVKGSVTLIDAEIAASADPSLVGNKPRRQADYIFNITPYYSAANWDVGANFVGTDDVFVADSNQLKFDSYITANVFINYVFNDQITVSLNANNLFDEVGFTEGEEGSATAGSFVRIRPINGRTVSASVRYDF